MTAQWVKYDGSDKQIEEMAEAGSFIIKADGVESHVMHHIDERGLLVDCDEYLICNRHKYAKLIQRWSITGQPVWYKHRFIESTGECGSFHPAFCQPETYEYSFTEFKEEV